MSGGCYSPLNTFEHVDESGLFDVSVDTERSCLWLFV